MDQYKASEPVQRPRSEQPQSRNSSIASGDNLDQASSYRLFDSIDFQNGTRWPDTDRSLYYGSIQSRYGSLTDPTHRPASIDSGDIYVSPISGSLFSADASVSPISTYERRNVSNYSVTGEPRHIAATGRPRQIQQNSQVSHTVSPEYGQNHWFASEHDCAMLPRPLNINRREDTDCVGPTSPSIYTPTDIQQSSLSPDYVHVLSGMDDLSLSASALPSRSRHVAQDTPEPEQGFDGSVDMSLFAEAMAGLPDLVMGEDDSPQQAPLASHRAMAVAQASQSVDHDGDDGGAPVDEELPSYAESQRIYAAQTRRAAVDRAQELQRRWALRYGR